MSNGANAVPNPGLCCNLMNFISLLLKGRCILKMHWKSTCKQIETLVESYTANR